MSKNLIKAYLLLFVLGLGVYKITSRNSDKDYDPNHITLRGTEGVGELNTEEQKKVIQFCVSNPSAPMCH